MQGDMQYMENHFEQRIDPTLLVPGAQSVVTLLYNYFPSETQTAGSPKVSRYAYGKDYHTVIRNKLNALLGLIKEHIGDVDGRGFVDSAPVLERSWAVHSGLGWVGKNGNLLTRKAGSYFFIATLITDLELIADDPFARDFCGSCNRCVEACPTEAILPGKVVDGSKCISYFTIELKENLIPDAFQGQFDNWLFGCDTCQEVCPWNRFAKAHQHPELKPIPQLLNMNTAEWEALSEEQFKEIFKDSPLKRAKYSGIRRNLKFLKMGG
jgi:epoxyqueuosine reductase